MIVTCPACATRFVVDPAALGPQGRMVRCARCAETWFQAPPPPEERLSLSPEPARPEPIRQEPVMTPPPAADGTPAVPTEPMPSFIGGRDRLDRPKLPALRQPPPRFSTIQLGWAALGGFVTVLIVVFLFFRVEIASAWPNTQRLYGLFGFEAPGPENWFALNGLKTATETTDGQANLVVSGEVANLSGGAHPVPKLRVTLLDAKGNMVKTKDFQVTPDPLPPGKTAPFQTSVAPVPEGTASVNVNWAGE
jgi:predicted Zn finger-like uncharacterized protein